MTAPNSDLTTIIARPWLRKLQAALTLLSIDEGCQHALICGEEYVVQVGGHEVCSRCLEYAVELIELAKLHRRLHS